MRIRDLLSLSFDSIQAQRTRAALTALGIAVGIASVVVLTSIGEGVRLFVLAEFGGFGTNVISVKPGTTDTRGAAGGITATIRPLTMDDAYALDRVRGVSAVVPLVRGTADIKFENRTRSSNVVGATPDLQTLWQLSVARGRFLPKTGLDVARAQTVVGSTIASELFPAGNALGSLLRIAGEPYRIIGVLKPKGEILGVNVDDTVVVPTVGAMAMFNVNGVMEIAVLFRKGANEQVIAERIEHLLKRRHGRVDFTITTQDEMLRRLDTVLSIITLTVAGLGAISLLVGGIGIMTIMTIAVTERTAEIGLLRAIGTKQHEILRLFLIEAMALSALGGLGGLAVGLLVVAVAGLLIPDIPTHISVVYTGAAAALSLAIGLSAGVAPARAAARMNPIDALRSE